MEFCISLKKRKTDIFWCHQVVGNRDAKYIYDNDSDEEKQIKETALNAAGDRDEAEERTVGIYESANVFEDYNPNLYTRIATTQSTLHQHLSE